MGNGVDVMKKSWSMRKDNLVGYVFIFLFIIGFLCFMVILMGVFLFLFFISYDLFIVLKWIGFNNYKEMFMGDEKYWQLLKVMFMYVFVGVLFCFGFVFFIVVILNNVLKGMVIYRMFFYLFLIIGGSVVVVIMWCNIFGNDGVINVLLFFVGID